MNTKKTSFLMLCIGLAMGILIGHSFTDQSITPEERAYLKEREVLNAHVERFKTAYALDSNIRVLEVQENVGVIQLPRQKAPRIEIQSRHSHPVFEKYRKLNHGPDLDQDMDLIDMRYTPPQFGTP